MKKVEIWRDGKLITTCDNIAAAWHWVHSNTSYSVAWAEKWEGYKLVELTRDAEPVCRNAGLFKCGKLDPSAVIDGRCQGCGEGVKS
jgi:hypothetical protein